MQGHGFVLLRKGSIQPVLAEFEVPNLTTITFLLEHPSLTKRLLSSSGARKDFENYSPATKRQLNINNMDLNVEKDTHETLEDAAVCLSSPDAIFRSLWH